MVLAEIFQSVKHFTLLIFPTILILVGIIIIWLPSFVYRCLVVIIASFKPDYENILSWSSSVLEEDFINLLPKCTLITVATIDGDISLEKLRLVFEDTVLNAEIPNESGKETCVRYPQLKQYLTTFMGYKFWRNDPDFQIENHITEQVFSSNSENRLATIHQELLNKTYPKDRSPWELILIRNNVSCNNRRGLPKCILALRLHHILADAKSVLKLLVDCLGQKPLKTAIPRQIENSLTERISWYLLFPVNFTRQSIHIIHNFVKTTSHPWNTRVENVQLVVGLSPKLALSDIKAIAKNNSVIPSSVILALVSGAVRNYDVEKLGNAKVYISCTQPKPNHPATLENHVYPGVVVLPCNESTPLRRLEECNKTMMEMKTTNSVKSNAALVFLLTTLWNPLRSLVAKNYWIPIGITNIAGDDDGFSIAGSLDCTELTMSVGTLPGCGGAVFCAFSYRKFMRIAVIAKESILSSTQAQTVADKIAAELESLKLLENV